MATRAYRELTGDEKAVWDRVNAVFDFRPSMHRVPAITEPARAWPSLVGPENIDPPGRPGWPLSPYPDGDYSIYLAEGFRFGTFGHPWELSLCVFGGV
ncbi:DUF2716 domain-containing protein [Plantactinospora sp. KBS50]|uniref:DUF2716 domain-containing protein n=1 Tax=Plantactinospora sp. KBS50 TaxID=2024580 RepID=UPI0018DFD8F1|nr:DUF2716 domain-containing protein [Plantactinospora sp. KBS50]